MYKKLRSCSPVRVNEKMRQLNSWDAARVERTVLGLHLRDKITTETMLLRRTWNISLYKYCSFLGGFEPWKTRARVNVCTKFEESGTALMRARGAARGASGHESAAVIISSEGAAVVRGRRPMIARC